MKYNINGIEKLRNAIVEDAAKEYITLKREIKKLEKLSITEKRAIRLQEKKNEFEYIRNWFSSGDFDALGLSHDGDYYIKQLDEMSDSKQIHHPIIERHTK